jgi:hypothetical protein
MKFEIEEEIVKLADKCPRDYVCLTGEGGLYCKVAVLMRGRDDEIPLLDCDTEVDCPYCQSFGQSYICNCPVRKEVFKRYGK